MRVNPSDYVGELHKSLKDLHGTIAASLQENTDRREDPKQAFAIHAEVVRWMEMEIMRFIMLTMVDHGALTLGISTL